MVINSTKRVRIVNDFFDGEALFLMRVPGEPLDAHPFRAAFEGKQRTIELQVVWECHFSLVPVVLCRAGLRASPVRNEAPHCLLSWCTERTLGTGAATHSHSGWCRVA